VSSSTPPTRQNRSLKNLALTAARCLRQDVRRPKKHGGKAMRSLRPSLVALLLLALRAETSMPRTDGNRGATGNT
jgi:hypothetical protein